MNNKRLAEILSLAYKGYYDPDFNSRGVRNNYMCNAIDVLYLYGVIDHQESREVHRFIDDLLEDIRHTLRGSLGLWYEPENVWCAAAHAYWKTLIKELRK